MTNAPDPGGIVRQAQSALARGDAAGARALLEAALRGGEGDAGLWLLMAKCQHVLGDRAGEGAAIDRALASAPKDLAALIAKGDYLAAEGDARAASSFYTAALQYMPRFQSLPVHLQEGLRRAQTVTQRLVRELEDFVRAKLDGDGVTANAMPPRFQNAVDIMFGRKRIYLQEPRYFYYPELPQIQFYERERFPWFATVEAAVEDVRDELRAVVGIDFKPYVTQAANRARKEQLGMADNPEWSAFFLHKEGRDQVGARRCPRTMACLAEAPLTRIPNRAPAVLFSKLAGGAHIPPHTGMLNARLVCHLPLIVPPGCEFRVGNDVRTWQEGKAWAFDDTIEHEAWNRSQSDRYILIFDVWRPELSVEECAAIAALCEAIDSYGGKVAWDA